MSWISDEEKLLNVSDCYVREEYPFINAHYVYINENDYIDNISCEELHFKWDISNNKGIIKNNTLLKLIEEKKNNNHKKYRFDEGCAFIIPLEPDDIYSFSETTQFEPFQEQFLKPITLLKDITLVPSIFIFHSINSLYFIFREVEHNKPTKSILKILNDPLVKSSKSKTKKRVRVSLPNKKNKTRKYLDVVNT